MASHPIQVVVKDNNVIDSNRTRVNNHLDSLKFRIFEKCKEISVRLEVKAERQPSGFRCWVTCKSIPQEVNRILIQFGYSRVSSGTYVKYFKNLR